MIPTINVIPPLVRFVYQRLATDEALKALVRDPETNQLRIYEAQASGERRDQRQPSLVQPFPQDPDFPCVRFKVMAATHKNGNGGRRGPTLALVQIEGIDAGEDLQAVAAISNRITALFAWRAQGEVDGLVISGSHTTEDQDTTEDSLPQTWKRLGGFYQLFCHQREG